MNFQKKIIELLENNMTERGFALWQGINKRMPNVWERPTSSTGKYHKKKNGNIPTQAEHTYHMLYSSFKLFRMFDINIKTPDADKILLAVALHDSLKYGQMGTRKHTDKLHDKNAADLICSNKETLLKLFTEEQFNTIQEGIRFHSGRWSSDVAKNTPFTFKDYNPETFFIHVLDMMSTADLIQTDVRD
jgi:hypothetical protein